jgi:hypothetical protein
MAVNLRKHIEFEYVNDIWALNSNVFNGPGEPAESDHLYSYSEVPLPWFRQNVEA